LKAPKSKLTNKEMTNVMTNLAMRCEQVVQMAINNDRVFNEYLEYKEDADDFTAWLKDKLEKNDKDTEKAEDK